jgi:hypothetical protein
MHRYFLSNPKSFARRRATMRTEEGRVYSRSLEITVLVITSKCQEKTITWKSGWRDIYADNRRPADSKSRFVALPITASVLDPSTPVLGINLVLARNYSENLREEVKKGMREKASQVGFPGHAPFGYRNDKADRTIEVDPVDSPMMIRLMELYATGAHTPSTLRKMLKTDFGKTMSRNNVHKILTNRFYIGSFEWSGETYHGAHPLFIDPKIFQRVQETLTGHNRPKYSKERGRFPGTDDLRPRWLHADRGCPETEVRLLPPYRQSRQMRTPAFQRRIFVRTSR